MIQFFNRMDCSSKYSTCVGVPCCVDMPLEMHIAAGLESIT